MTIIAYIGKQILHKEQINTLTDNKEKCSFNSNFYLLLNGSNIYDHLTIVQNNPFYQEGTKILILHLYSKIQKVVFALKKLVRRWKWYKALQSSVDSDLFMNSLENYPCEQKLKILQNGTIYNFRLTDFVKLWKLALCSSSSFTPRPCMPKNPYTNIPFNKGHLTACYMQLYNTRYTIPPLITIFWNLELHLTTFTEEAYPQLKEEAIYNYITSASDQILFYDIVAMISSLGKYIGRTISMNLADTVKTKFIYDMLPYLRQFLLSEHTYNPIRRRRLRRKVIKNLKKFFSEHPLAGRRIVYTSHRRMRCVSNNFSFNTSNIPNDSVFIFGASRADTEAEAASENVILESSEIEAVVLPESSDDEESYNEVLDDSDDETATAQQYVASNIQEEEEEEEEIINSQSDMETDSE